MALRSLGVISLFLVIVVAMSYAEPQPTNTSTTRDTAASTQPSIQAFSPVGNGRLHNAHRVTPKVISGAQPDDDEAFQALRELGIKTIISVDGATPDVLSAKKYGMRYVHLPIGYDGVSESDGKAIAKALDEMPGPIYIHCHHGKHRSAAAVAVACVYNGQLEPEQAETVLKTFGTGANYKGLWKAAREARRIDPEELKKLNVEFVEVKKIDDVAEMMVAVDQRTDHLKLLQKTGWQVPKDHPDLDPAHEALQLQEHLHEVGRLESVQARPEDFRRMLTEGDDASKALHEALSMRPVPIETVNAAFGRVSASCTACHAKYRD